MRRVRAFAIGLFSVAISVVLVAFAGIFLLLETERGRLFLESQTENLVERLVGPDYVAAIGSQSISLDRGGRLAIRWDGVSVTRVGMDQPEARAETIAAGIDAFALLGGEMKLRSLDVSGVDVDMSPTPEASEVAAAAQALAPGETTSVTPPVSAQAAKALLPAIAARLFGQSEKQIGNLVRLGIEEVNVADVRLTLPVAPGGGPFVASVETLRAELGDPGAMRLAGTLRVDGLLVPVETRVVFDPAASRLLQARSGIGPFDLEKLLPPGRRDDRNDIRPFGSDGDMTLVFEVASPQPMGPRQVDVTVQLEAGHVHQGRGHADIRTAVAALRYVEGEDRISVGPLRIEADDFETELSGTVTPVYDRPDDGGFNGFAFELASRGLRSFVGSTNAVESTAELLLAGRTDVSRRQGRLDRFELRSGDGALTGTASFGYGGPNGRLRLDLAFDNLAATAVKAFWPFDIAVMPRAWVVQNIGDAGRVSEGSIKLDVSRQRMDDSARLGVPYTPDEMQLDLALKGVRSKTFGELPALAEAEGTVEVRGGDTLITVGKARIDELEDSVLEGGLVTFSRVFDHDVPLTEMRLTGNFAGSAGDMARVTRRAPLASMVDLPFKPEDASGRVRTVADLTLLMGDKLPNGRQLKSWKVALALDDVGAKTPVMGRRLADFRGTVAVTPQAIEGDLEGSVDGAKGKAAFHRVLGPDAPSPRLKAEIRLDADEAAKLAPILSEVVTGPIVARIAQSDGGRIGVDVDLSGSTLDLPWLGWRKGKGIDAKLAFAVNRDGDRTIVDALSLKGEGFSAEGHAQADAEGLRTAELDKVELNPNDDVAVKLERVQNGYSIKIRGKRFDARPLLADIRSDIGGKTAKPKRGGRQFDVSAAVSEVIGFGRETISDFSLDFAGSGSRIAALSISGASRNAAPFSVELSPRGEARSIEISSDNAGALLDFTGAYAHMDGGRLRLVLMGVPEEGYTGKVEVKNFALVDEPRLSRLLAAPPAPNSQSLSQAVGRNLQTARAAFDNASAGIAFGKGGLALKDGIIRGPIFGSSFAGTVYDPKNRIDVSGSFMPAYGLNRVFGAIPVVGQILGNGREGGLIGITYRLSGEFASPKLEINPISAIAPGIFRNIFAYQ